MLGYYIAFKKYLKLVSNSRHVPLPSRYSFIQDQDGEDCALINATEFTYKFFRLLISRPRKAYKEFYKLKVAYDESEMRHADAQAKYTADLNHKDQKIAALKMRIEEISAHCRDQEAIISSEMLRDATSSGVTQSGGTYGGSIATASGHVRQGNDLAGKLHAYMCAALRQLANN